jgi:hypothetical protein
VAIGKLAMTAMERPTILSAWRRDGMKNHQLCWRDEQLKTAANAQPYGRLEHCGKRGKGDVGDPHGTLFARWQLARKLHKKVAAVLS